MKTQAREEPIEQKNDNGTICDSVKLYTYDDPEHIWVFLSGSSMDHDDQLINTLWTESDARAVRDALNRILGDA